MGIPLSACLYVHEVAVRELRQSLLLVSGHAVFGQSDECFISPSA